MESHVKHPVFLCQILVRHTHVETNKTKNLLMTSPCLCRDVQNHEMQPS